jgi:8-oxo-dGTP diphosphatase
MPSVSCDVVVFRNTPNGTDILMIRRKNEPYKDGLALPGGFMEINEVLRDCAVRELKEEVNLTVDSALDLFSIGVFDRVDRDPRQRVITHVFASEYHPEQGEIKGGDDAYDPQWYPIVDLLNQNKYKLAFDHYFILLSAYPSIK